MTNPNDDEQVERAIRTDRSPAENRWRSVKGFVQRHPWLSGAILLFVAAGMLPLLGILSIQTARTWLFVGLCVLLSMQAGFWLWKRSRKRSPAAAAAVGSQRAANAKGSFLGTSAFGWFVAGCIVLALRNSERGPVAKQAREFQQVVKQRADAREAVVAYWNSTVAALHRPRFRLESSSLSALDDHQARLREWEEALGKAVSAAPGNVDPELVEALNRHLEVDRRGIDLLREGLAIVDRLKARDIELTRLSAIDARLRFENATPEELDALPAELKALLERNEQLTVSLNDLLHEVEILQAKLNERYKPARFELPQLDAND